MSGAGSRPDLHRKLAEAVETYNKYRSPEAQCRLEGVSEDEVVVRFWGPFCLTCGVIDWVEDFIYTLKEVGVEAQISDVEYRAGEMYLVARLKLKG